MNNLKPYTIETTFSVLAFLCLAFVFFHYIYPMIRQSIKESKMYPEARKHHKSEIKKEEKELLDYLLMPDDFPNLEDRIIFDEHEKAIS